jgi:tetratricopeptide (TPR) repeat protein
MRKIKRSFSVFLLGVLLCSTALGGSVFAEEGDAAAEKIRLLNVEIIAANERRDLPAALQAAEEAVRVAKAGFGTESLESADTMSNLASLYLYIKRADEAAAIYESVAGIYFACRGPESLETATAYFNLGAAYAMQKKYKEALRALNKALAIRVKKLGSEDGATKNAEQMIAELNKLAYPNSEKI